MKEPEPRPRPKPEPRPEPEPGPKTKTKRTYKILFPQGWFMHWDMYTQAVAIYTVTLTDIDTGSKYMYDTGGGQNIDDVFARGHDVIEGSKNLQLTVEVDKTIFKDHIHEYTIYHAGEPVVYGFNLFVENGGDDDFNDFNAFIVCWKRSG